MTTQGNVNPEDNTYFLFVFNQSLPHTTVAI